MKLNGYTYSYPYTRPFITAKDHYINREGLYMVLDKKGVRSLGEAAPLPGFSDELLTDIISQIRNRHADITRFFETPITLENTQSFISDPTLYPSVQFAILTAAVLHMAQLQQTNPQQILSDQAPSEVAVNAVLGLNNCDTEQITRVLTEGYQTIKLKADANIEKLENSLKKIRKRAPEIKIRIDANQSWPRDKVLHFLRRIEPYSVEYCEEPVASPDADLITELQNQSRVPIALDESLTKYFSLREALEISPAVVIKPTVLGSSIMDQPAAYHSNNHTLVFTTALESGVGRLMTAILASSFGSPQTAHGLSTGHLLANDIWNDETFLQDGSFRLPDTNKVSSLMNTSLTKLPLQLIEL